VAGHPVYAWVYDRLSRAEERGEMGERREALLAGASGRVVEIGPGTGLNFAHYPAAVAEVVAVEPDPHMLRRAAAAAAPASVPVRLVRGAAERLPLEDGGFDLAVATLVLCTVRDQGRALAELRRVLRPGGSLLFFEHVRSARPTHARWQDRLDRPWGWVAGGCHANRDTVAAIEGAGFEIERLERFPYGPPAPTRPHATGAAVSPG
jgi:SAM-dependent methyltransferase